MAEETQKKPRIDLLYANGVNAETGEYALPPISPADFKKGIKGGPVEPDSKSLKNWQKWRKARNYALEEGRDPKKLGESGWGAVFPVNADPAVVEALKPLLDWRKEQAGDLYKIFVDNPVGAVRPMDVDSKGVWLGRQGAENYGPVNPTKVPYYLLLVGDPNQIDYRFQYMLDVQYAVGRICFDTPDEYARYAESVVEAEKKQIQRKRQISFFGVANNGDVATQLSSQYLIDPLAQFTRGVKFDNAAAWDVQTILKDAALKQRLASFLGGAEMPGLLFTASHGMEFPSNPDVQLHRQGALLCQDWPGPSWRKPIPQDAYFSAEDLEASANLQGLIAFFFACYGAGTPQFDEFYRAAFKDRGPIAPKSFIAPLPQKMLAQGAQAVIGHVERAWGYSFMVDDSPSLQAFRSALQSLMSGAPVGLAFEYFNMRYAEFATDLTDKVQRDDWDPVDALDMANSWTATNDSKNYVVLGDPAVRVRVAEQPTDTPPPLQPVVVTITSQPSAEGAGNGASVTAGAPDQKAAGVPPAAAVDYGLVEDLTHLKSTLGNSISQFAQKLSTFLGAAIDNAATLEVSTYAAPDLAKVSITGSQISGADLRAMTVLRIDGDIKQIVPLNDEGEPDAALWALHLEMVRLAQTNRTQLLNSAVSALSSLVNLGGLK